MKRIGHLYEKIISFNNLWSAAHRAGLGKRDNPRIAAFFFHLEKELITLQQELIDGTYRPRDYRIFEVFEPKRRHIAAADFRDRVVHHAIIAHLEPNFEKSLISDTYACRTGKGTHAAIKRAQVFSRRNYGFLKCDIRKFFQSMDHDVLRLLLEKRIKDAHLFDLLNRIIDHPLPDHEPGKGVPIGNLTSQHFANLYLSELDHFVKEGLRIRGYLRYMDDFLIFSHSIPVLQGIHFEVREFLSSRLKLELKHTATMISPVGEGIPFLGFRVYPGTIRLSGKGRYRTIRKVKERMEAHRSGIMDETLLSNSVGSMIGHMTHADTQAFRKSLFCCLRGSGIAVEEAPTG